MPIRKNKIYPGGLYHIYNRSVGKKTIFHSSQDYGRFLMKAREYKKLFKIDILAYCIMPNHFHFLIREPLDAVRPTPGVGGDTGCRSLGEKFFHRLQSAYARYYVNKYAESHSGYLFQGRYHAKHVTNDKYLFSIVPYIHDNPVRKNIVNHPKAWSYSSFSDLVKINKDELTSHDDLLAECDHEKMWVEYTKKRDEVWDKIRDFT